MRRFYWYCITCRTRGNKLFEKRSDVQKKIERHKATCLGNCKIYSTKSAYVPIHI